MPATPQTDDRMPARATRYGRIWAVLRRAARLGFVVVAVSAAGYAVVSQWSQVQSGLARLGLFPIVGALLAVIAGLGATGQVWRVLLAGLGSPLRLGAASRVFFVGQLGKYLPGALWPVLAQMDLAHRHGVPHRRSATAAALTMLICLCAAVTVAAATLPWLAVGELARYRWLVLLAAPAMLVVLHPRMLNPLLGRVLRLVGRPALERPLTWRHVGTAMSWALMSWLLFGLQLWWLATELGAPAGRAGLVAVGGFALAWSLGFVVLLAPAGAGMREAALVAVLSPLLTGADGLVVALMSRLLMTVGDLVLAGLAYLPARQPRGSAPAPRP